VRRREVNSIRISTFDSDENPRRSLVSGTGYRDRLGRVGLSGRCDLADFDAQRLAPPFDEAARN
jgi:hypothetical protein